VCWLAFSLAIAFAIATLWLSLRLYGLQGFVMYARKHLRERVKDIEIGELVENLGPLAATLVDTVIGDQLMTMEKYDKRATKALKATLVMFLVGLLFTGVLGWTQLMGI
jgi:hypothetical protein